MTKTEVLELDKAGTLVDFTNEGKKALDIVYASVTAPGIVKVEVRVNDELQDAVYVGAGGSHSWWMNAGGKLLPHNGLASGDKLKIIASGKCALRIDWVG
jgi:uncharacterized RmlC-like cupin family protein